MTIRLLRPFEAYPINAIVTLDRATESALVAQLAATYSTTGGVPIGQNDPFDNNRLAVRGAACEDFGASPNASAQNNFAAIQSALNTNGAATLCTPGVYAIPDDAFSSSSFASLNVGPGVHFSINGVIVQPGSLENARNTARDRLQKQRRSGVVTTTSSTWTVSTTGSSGTATKNSAYPIRQQPTVTPLLMTGTSTGAGQYVRATQTLSPGITSRKIAISVPVFIPDYTKVASITISVSYDGFASTSWATVYTPEFSGLHVIGLSSRIVQGLAGGLQYTTGTAAGTETPFTSLRYQMTMATSVTGAQAAFGDPIVNAGDVARLAVCVDDGEALIMRQLDSSLPWSPFEYAVQAGVPFTHFLIPALLNTNGYLSTTDVQQILAAGHCIGPHGQTSLASFGSDAARRQDIESNISGLLALGVPREMLYSAYAYPSGVFEVTAGDTSIQAMLADIGIRSARTASRRATVPNHTIPHRQYHIPIIGHYTDVGGGGETTAITLARIRDLVETGGTATLLFHKFTLGIPVSDLEIQFSEFRAIMDAIAAYRDAGSLLPVTMMDVANDYYLAPPTVTVS